MDEQLTFEFAERTTIKGFLNFVGPERDHIAPHSITLHSCASVMARKGTDGSIRYFGAITFR